MGGLKVVKIKNKQSGEQVFVNECDWDKESYREGWEGFELVAEEAAAEEPAEEAKKPASKKKATKKAAE